MKVKAMKEMVVDSISCGNSLLDKYYTGDIQEFCDILFATGTDNAITEWEVNNNQLRVRGIHV
jgi:hypothetical protein